MIKISTDVLDFGTIKQTNGRWHGEVTVTNESTKPVTGIRVVASCGCTKPQFPNSLLAGQTQVMKVEFNPTGKSGFISKTITLSAPNEVHKIKLRGTVEV